MANSGCYYPSSGNTSNPVSHGNFARNHRVHLPQFWQAGWQYDSRESYPSLLGLRPAKWHCYAAQSADWPSTQACQPTAHLHPSPLPASTKPA